MPRWPWIERRFHFDFPPAKFPDLLERWRGTPARLTDRLTGVGSEILTAHPDAGWSIQENVGHLLEVERLALRRLEQILRGERELVAADMENRGTHAAGYNERAFSEVLAGFRAARLHAVQRFEAVDPADWGRSATHPRLQQPMRIVDLLCFFCEHDDYHLGRIGELLRILVPVPRGA